MPEYEPDTIVETKRFHTRFYPAQWGSAEKILVSVGGLFLILVVACLAGTLILGGPTRVISTLGNSDSPNPAPIMTAGPSPSMSATPTTSATPPVLSVPQVPFTQTPGPPVASSSPDLDTGPEVPLDLSAACQWAYPGQADGRLQGWEPYGLVCLDMSGDSLGGFPDGSGHSLNDRCGWLADHPEFPGGGYEGLTQAKYSYSEQRWVCTVPVAAPSPELASRL